MDECMGGRSASPLLSRRGFGLGAFGTLSVSLLQRTALCAEDTKPRFVVPVRFCEAISVPTARLLAQRAEAERLYPMFQFQWPTETEAIDTKFAKLDTRGDRDDLRKLLSARVVNVFFVESLRDVDDRALYRRGVHWRPAPNPGVRYIIVIRDAPDSVLAHELGHYFGLPHVATKNNLMSYDRDGGEVFLNDAQRSTIASVAKGLLGRGELVPRTPPR